jgi:ABC-type sugar transport system substrate-binding protein
MSKRVLFLMSILLIGSILLAGCQPAVAPAEEAAPAEEKEKPFFGFVMHNFESEFSVEIKVGAEVACEEYADDVTCEVTGPTKMDAPAAISMFEGLLAKNPSGMTVVPNPQDPWKPILNQYAEEAKIIMVTNGDAPGTPRQAYFACDEVAFGRALAQVVIDAGVTSGLVIVGSCYPPALPLQLRDQGVREVFADYPDLIVETYDSTAEQTTNYAFWENTVTANPDIKAGIGLCTFEGPTYADLMPKLNAEGIEFVTVTADLIPETLDAIENGYIDAAIGQHPFLQGYLPMYFMIRHVLYGEELPSGQVMLPAEIVNIDNLDTVKERAADAEKAQEWYADFLSENLESIKANVVPFTD